MRVQGKFTSLIFISMNLFFKYFQKSVLFLVDIMYFVKKRTFYIILDKKSESKGEIEGKTANYFTY